MRGPRSRTRAAAALATVIALGLATRRVPQWFPAFVAEHGGDALWATAAWLVVALVLPARSALATTAVAATFAALVELGQLVRADWLDAVRDLPGMRLVLGYGFDAWDLARYAAGIAVGAALDPWLRAPRRQLVKSAKPQSL